jgi:hypothetical protein
MTWAKGMKKRKRVVIFLLIPLFCVTWAIGWAIANSGQLFKSHDTKISNLCLQVSSYPKNSL